MYVNVKMLVIVAILALGVGAQLAATNNEDVLLYVPFDGMPDAVLAKGVKQAKLLGNPIYVEGKKGKALLFRPGEYLRFDVKDNIKAEKGTLKLWVKITQYSKVQKYVPPSCQLLCAGSLEDTLPEKWFTAPLPLRITSFLSQTDTPAYKQGDEILSFGLASNGLNPRFPGAICRNRLKDGEWHHLSFTWSKREIRIYLDGEMAGRQSVPAIDLYPTSFGDFLYVGQSIAALAGECAIDDLWVYDRVLSDSEVKVDAGISKQDIFTATRCVATPQIDGDISDGEWDNTTQITAFLDLKRQLADKQALCHLAYDDDKLYVLIVSKLSGQSLKTDIKENDGKIYTDDSVELFIAPDLDKEIYYQFIFNATGAKYDSKIGDDNKVVNLEWNSTAKSASQVKDGKWIVEIAVPFKEIGVMSQTLGKTLGFSVCRSYVVPKDSSLDMGEYRRIHTSLAGYHENVSNYAKLVLADSASVVKMEIGDKFNAGEVKLNLNVTNLPPSSQLSYEWELSLKDKSLKKSGFLNPEPASNITQLDIFENFPFTSEPQAGTLSFNLKTVNGEILIHRSIPFVVTPSFKFDYLVDRIGNKMLLEIDTHLLGSDARQGKILAEIINNEGKAIMSQREDDINKKMISLSFNLDSFPEQVALLVRISLFDKENRVISSMEKPCQKMEKATRIHCDLGNDDSIPPPFTPLKYDGLKVSCWNREYDFKEGSLLDQVKIGTDTILSSPVTLQGNADGKPFNFRMGDTKWLEQKGDKGILVFKSGSDDLQLQGKITVEFDGMIRVDAELSSTKGANLEQLFLEIPLKTAIAKYVFASQSDELDKDIAYFSDWQGRIGKLTDSWTYQFCPVVWVGDDDKGFCWFAENDKDWCLSDEKKAIKILRQNENSFLRINYVDSAQKTLKQPFAFTFGLQATPMRPRPADWRKYCGGGFEKSNDVANLIICGWGGCGSEKNVSWKPSWLKWPLLYDHKSLDKEIDLASKIGRESIFPYSLLYNCDVSVPEVRYYLEDWSMSKSNGHVRELPKNWNYDKEHDLGNFCYQAQGYCNLLLNELQQILTQHPNIKGLYHDGCWPQKCDNPLHGCGYIKNGKWSKSYPLFASRELHKRIYKIVKNMGGDRMVFAHASCTRFIPEQAFFDMAFDGEHLGHDLAINGCDYVDVISLDRWRAEYTFRQTGVIPMLLPQNQRAFSNWNKKPEALPELWAKSTRTLLSMLLIHDINFCITLCSQEEMIVCKKTLDTFGTVDSEFLPYWNNEDVVTSSSDKLKVSIYRKNGKSLLLLANIGNDDLSTNVKINFQKLGLQGSLNAQDLLTKQDISITDAGLISVKVPKKDYAMVLLSSCILN